MFSVFVNNREIIITECRQKQSIQQIGALFILILAAVLLSIGEGSRKSYGSDNRDEIVLYGMVPVWNSFSDGYINELLCCCHFL